MKLSRNTKIFINYVLGPLLFFWLSYSLYTQIKHQKGLAEAWNQIKQTPAATVAVYLVSVVALMLVNWLIEAMKWKLVLKNVQQLSLWNSFKAILSGVSFSATTPNRVGEYAGRVLFLDEGNRLRSVSLTIVCSISQLLVTMIMGCAGLFFLQHQLSDAKIISGALSDSWVLVFLFGSLAVLILLGIFYFKISLFSTWLEKRTWMKRFKYLVEELNQAKPELLFRLFLLSLIRFIVFCFQYYLLFRLFGVEVTFWQSFWVISVAFLVLAVIPTIAIAELGLRSTIVWELIKIFTANSLGVTIATASIWFVNLIIPAIAGSILIAGVRLYKKRKEAD